MAISLKDRWTVAAGLLLGLAVWSVQDSWRDIDDAKKLKSDVEKLDQRLQAAVSTLQGFPKRMEVMDHPLPQTDEEKKDGVDSQEIASEVLQLSNEAKVFLAGLEVKGRDASPSCWRLAEIVKLPQTRDDDLNGAAFIPQLSRLMLEYDDSIVKQRVMYDVFLSDFGRRYIASSEARKALMEYETYVLGFEKSVNDTKPEIEAHRSRVNVTFMKNWERREWIKLYREGCAVDMMPRTP